MSPRIPLRSCSLCILALYLAVGASGSPVYNSYNNEVPYQDSMPVDPRGDAGSSFVGVERELPPMEEAKWMADISPSMLGKETISDGAPIMKRYGENAITNYSARLNRYRLYKIQQNMFRNMLMNQRDDKDAVAKRSEGAFTSIWAKLRQRHLNLIRNKALNNMVNYRLRRTDRDSTVWEPYNVQP